MRKFRAEYACETDQSCFCVDGQVRTALGSDGGVADGIATVQGHVQGVLMQEEAAVALSQGEAGPRSAHHLQGCRRGVLFVRCTAGSNSPSGRSLADRPLALVLLQAPVTTMGLRRRRMARRGAGCGSWRRRWTSWSRRRPCCRKPKPRCGPVLHALSVARARQILWMIGALLYLLLMYPWAC